MKPVKLSSDALREVFRWLARASLARHLRCVAAEQGDLEQAHFYRSENRRSLVEARCLVQADLNGLQLQEEVRNAAAKVSPSSAPRELHLLCMLVEHRDGLKSLPVHTLSRLQAPWAPVSRKWAVALPYPLFMRPAFGKAPGGTVLARCFGYWVARAVCSNPRTVRLTAGDRVSPA